MGYTYKNAIQTIIQYLNLNSNDVRYIPNTKDRGILLHINDEDCVIFTGPISCKKDNKQSWIDTRDSGTRERKTCWNYAKEHNLKFFYLCVNSEQVKYQNYFFSLENSEQFISNISFRKKENQNGTGTQANIDNTFNPTNNFERFTNGNGFNFAVISKEKIFDYLTYFDNRPYTFGEDEQPSKKGEDSLNLVGENTIYYGIPGCGKSYYIENTKLKDKDKSNIFRTTFYLDYSNSDFVGQIYPIVDADGHVNYDPVPGPFTKALARALTTDKMVYLVIEEINRGNAAAIFGDIFQLLDRLNLDKNGRLKGDSEYPISNQFIESYFNHVNKNAKNEDEKIKFEHDQIYIPHNLTIFATMNTSDQNVFPLDTAFKRRWNRKKIMVNWDKVKEIKEYYIPFSTITWQDFATTINNKMLIGNGEDLIISEDKQMGPYFVKKEILVDSTVEIRKKDIEKIKLQDFTSNVFDYLFNDVTKFDHTVLFNENIITYDQIYELLMDYADSVEADEDNNIEIRNNNIFDNILNSNIVELLNNEQNNYEEY